MLAIRLPREIEDRLDDLAMKTGRTRTYYAREAILEYLSDLERIHFAAARVAGRMHRPPPKRVGRSPHKGKRLLPAEIREAVRGLGLSTPAESTRMIREDRDAR
ncbi:MAG: hypothetical protein OHK0028_13550 [Deltaproteobacteria bacterium]